MNLDMKRLLQRVKKTLISPTILNMFLAIGTGLLVGFILMFVIAERKLDSVSGLSQLLFGGVESTRMIGNVLFSAAPLILVGLSVAFAFKTGLFNIGASGQFMVGGIAALYVANLLSLPPFIHFVVAVLAAVSAGALWGFVPGLLKARFNVNEVITTIMMNYIAGYSSAIAASYPKVYDEGITAINISFPTAEIPKFGLDALFPGSYIDISIVIAIVTSVLIWVVLKKTTFGYEIQAVGASQSGSKYAGINVGKNVILSMMIAGGIAGLAAGMNYLPHDPDYLRTYTAIHPMGFEGISIALIANSNPIGIIFSGIFISHLKKGALSMQFFGYSKEIATIVMSVIIYMIAISSFIGHYFQDRRIKKDILLDKEQKEIDDHV